MKIIVIALLLLGAQFSLTAFAPAEKGKAWILWPFSADSHPWLSFIGGLPAQSGSILTPLLAGLAGLGFLAAVGSLLGIVIPAKWLLTLVLVSSAASLLLFVLYFNALALAPIVVDVALLCGVMSQGWLTRFVH